MSDIVDGKTMRERVDRRLRLVRHLEEVQELAKVGCHTLMRSPIGSIEYDMEKLTDDYYQTKCKIAKSLEDIPS